MDGITVRGAAHVSSQHITGEAQPILAEEGTELLAGSLSTDSWLILRATKVARESALARIAELTEFAKVWCCRGPCPPEHENNSCSRCQKEQCVLTPMLHVGGAGFSCIT